MTVPPVVGSDEWGMTVPPVVGSDEASAGMWSCSQKIRTTPE
jgi:hypothetical protein